MLRLFPFVLLALSVTACAPSGNGGLETFFATKPNSRFETIPATGKWIFSVYKDEMTDKERLVSRISSGKATLFVISTRSSTSGFKAYIDYDDGFICAGSGANFAVRFDDSKVVENSFDSKRLSKSEDVIFLFSNYHKFIGDPWTKNEMSNAQFIKNLHSAKELRIRVSDSCGEGGTFLFPLEGRPHLRVIDTPELN